MAPIFAPDARTRQARLVHKHTTIHALGPWRSEDRLRRRSASIHLRTLLLALATLALVLPRRAAAQSQDPQLLNGGSVLAMAGDECVAVAVDRRFGSGPQVVNVGPRTVLAPSPRLLVAFTGLEGDVQSLADELSAQVSAKVGRSSGFGFGDGTDAAGAKAISPRSMATLTSHVLYGRRRAPYYVEPIVAGLERVLGEEKKIFDRERKQGLDGEDHTGNAVRENGADSSTPGGGVALPTAETETLTRQLKREVVQYQPYLCAQDVIGARSTSQSFVCSGAASKSMYGIAEAVWKPGLKPEDLARVCGQAFLSALERDCLSGYGAVLYIVTKDGIVEYELVCRND